MKLHFLGAAETVTGSRTMLCHKNEKYLVDCGFFQGPREIRSKNWEPFENAKEVRAVILTHAHVDHSGYLPKLVKDGFRGPIYCSAGTADLCRIILLDTAHLQEEEARYANKTKYSRHQPARPLFTTHDAHRAIELLTPVPMNEWHALGDELHFYLYRSGHILGSTFVELSYPGTNGAKRVTFSGDLGSGNSQILRNPEQLRETETLVLEGTYGDRVHSRNSPLEQISQAIHKIEKTRGALVIPAFSIGRTQELLYFIRALEDQKEIPSLPVYVDSPMALNATEIYLKHVEELKLIIRDGKFESSLCTSCYRPVQDVEESMSLCQREGPIIVISAAGMLTGGRILHHLKSRLSDERNVVLFTGYQAEGTKGRLLQNGMNEIRIHRQPIEVKAEIVTIDALSAHADSEGIIRWLKSAPVLPKRIILNHGSPSSLKALQYRIKYELNLDAVIPKMGERVDLVV